MKKYIGTLTIDANNFRIEVENVEVDEIIFKDSILLSMDIEKIVEIINEKIRNKDQFQWEDLLFTGKNKERRIEEILRIHDMNYVNYMVEKEWVEISSSWEYKTLSPFYISYDSNRRTWIYD